MPKEQIRKRGRRKPKTEVGAGGAPIDEPQLELAPSAPTDAPGPSGIHPSRAALLKGGPRPRYEAPVPTTDQPHTQDEQENGAAQWERGPRIDSEFPFGVLDPDVKAYFRNVEDQIKDWEGVNSVGEEREGEKH
jgi:nucleolar protein 9